MDANDPNNPPPAPRDAANKDASFLRTSADDSAAAAFDLFAEEADTPLVIGPRSDAAASDPHPGAVADGRRDGDEPLGDSSSLQGRDIHASIAGITLEVTDSLPEAGVHRSFTWNVSLAGNAVETNVDSPADCLSDAEERNADSPADGSDFDDGSTTLRWASIHLPEGFTIDPLTGLISGPDPGWGWSSSAVIINDQDGATDNQTYPWAVCDTNHLPGAST